MPDDPYGGRDPQVENRCVIRNKLEKKQELFEQNLPRLLDGGGYRS